MRRFMAVLGLLLLGLAGCAGTPPASQPPASTAQHTVETDDANNQVIRGLKAGDSFWWKTQIEEWRKFTLIAVKPPALESSLPPFVIVPGPGDTWFVQDEIGLMFRLDQQADGSVNVVAPQPSQLSATQL